MAELRDRMKRYGERRARAMAVALGAIGLLALGALTARVANAYPVSSDDATGMLEAASVLQGNLLLQGWTLSNVSFVATDLPFYVVGVAIRGLDPALLRAVPSAVYAAAVGMAVVLAAAGVRSARLAAATAAILIGLPAGGLAEFVTKGYTRVGTSMGLFAALLALAGPVGRKVSAARLALYTAAVALSQLSDVYVLVIIASPVLAVCLLGAVRRQGYEGLGLGRIAIATILAVPLGNATTWAIHKLGGYVMMPLPFRDYLSSGESFRHVHAHLRALADHLPSLYRCDWPHGGGWSGWAVWLGCLIGPILLVCALWLGRPVGPRARGDFVGDVLWMSMGAALAAFVVSANVKDRGTMRYMVPFVLSGAVLTARAVAQRPHLARRLTPVLSVLAAAYGTTIAWDLRKPHADDPAVKLAAWLDGRGLRHGYGPFWDASIVTASGRSRVAVRPIRGRDLESGRLVVEPFRWMSNVAWYSDAPANFVVFRPDPGPRYHYRINAENCERWFGPPSERYTVGPYVVLVWAEDLRPRLTRGLPWTP